MGVAGLGGYQQPTKQFSSGNSNLGDNEEYMNNCSSVKEYAYTENRNSRFRPGMEDSKFRRPF